MVQLLSFGLLGLCALTQIASAMPEPMKDQGTVSKITTSVTKTVTITKANGRKTITTTTVVPTVIRTTVSPTTKKRTKTTKTTTTTTNPTPIARTCASIGSGDFTDADGVTYHVACGVDYYGGDLGIFEGASFENCFRGCDKEPGCVAFAWVGRDAEHVGPGNCYLKSSLLEGVSNSNVDSAHIKK